VNGVRIRITWGSESIEGTLNGSETAAKIAAALPQTSSANTWGEEVYFSVPVETELEADPQVVVDPGTICFWVQGSAVALPYGPTPISEGKECRLVTAVNVIGTLDGDPRALASIADGDAITIEAAE
jgi:hypothetical protein